jgi:hypothetical protein
MTMLDLGSSGTALGVASAASGFVVEPLAGADGVAAFCPPCGVAPCAGDAEGDAFGGVLWPEAAGGALGLVAEVPGLEGDGFGGVFCPEVAGATLGLVAEVPGLEGLACPSGAVTGAVAVGVVAAACPVGLVSALAGKAKAIAKNGTASRLRNCGKEAEKPICSTLVAQNPIARRPLDRAS